MEFAFRVVEKEWFAVAADFYSQYDYISRNRNITLLVSRPPIPSFVLGLPFFLWTQLTYQF